MANAKPQDHTKATYAQKVTKEMGHIDWKQEASVIDALIRGMYPSPGTYTYFHGKRIKIHRAFYEHKDTAATPKGTIVSLKDGKIGVAATHGNKRHRLLMPLFAECILPREHTPISMGNG